MSTPKFTVSLLGLLAAAVVMAFVSPAPVMGQARDAKQSTADQEKLQGTWQIRSLALSDKVIARDAVPAGWKETFAKAIFIEKDQLGQVGHSRAKFELDDTRTPKQITVRDDAGKLSFHGIYTLDGDTLKVCVNGDGKSKERPTAFAPQKDAPLVLIELQRITEKK